MGCRVTVGHVHALEAVLVLVFSRHQISKEVAISSLGREFSLKKKIKSFGGVL